MVTRILKKDLDFIHKKNYQEYLKEIFNGIKKLERNIIRNFNNFNHFVTKTFKIILKNSIIYVINIFLNEGGVFKSHYPTN